MISCNAAIKTSHRCWLEHGADIAKVQEWLGHTGI